MIEGRKVLYVSLEMSEDKIAQRFDSIMTLVPQSKLKDPANQLTVNERLEIFKEEFPGVNLLSRSSLLVKLQLIPFETSWYNLKTMRSLSLIF